MPRIIKSVKIRHLAPPIIEKASFFSKETPKFNAARESRKRSNDRSDFAIDVDDDDSKRGGEGRKNNQKIMVEMESTDDSETNMVYSMASSTNKSQQNRRLIGDSSEDEDEAGLVVLEDEEDDSDEDKERGLTKFGPMIDSESDDEDGSDDDEEEDEFLFNDDESDDSVDLPQADEKNALFAQFYSQSDGYAFYETQKSQSLQSRNNRFANHHRDGLLKFKSETKRDKKDDIFEIIKEKKKKDKELKTKRIIKILKDLNKEGRIKAVFNGEDSENVQDDVFNEEELIELTLIANNSLTATKKENSSTKPTLSTSKSMNNGPYTSPFSSK